MIRPGATRTRRGALVASLAAGLVAVGVIGSTPAASGQDTGLGDLPVNPEWLANTLGRAADIGGVKNNLTDGAIERRDKAVAEWKAAQAAYKAGTGPAPNPLAKPEYNVVWSSKQNLADTHADVINKFIAAATVN